VNDLFAIHTKQAAYRTYVIGARIPAGSVARALYWDTCEEPESQAASRSPYHYVRLARIPGSPHTELLIVGGGDHKTGQAHDAEERFARLETWTRERFPVDSIVYRWSGQVMESVDSLAFIGRNPGDRNVYVATGDSTNGMTHGTIAGILLSALIQGRDHDWAKLYDPSRVTFGAAVAFTEENVNVAAQYADWVTPGVGVQWELRPVLARRDLRFALSLRSARSAGGDGHEPGRRRERRQALQLATVRTRRFARRRPVSTAR
jgi:hypothetical protein